jgi:hypothetical protein
MKLQLEIIRSARVYMRRMNKLTTIPNILAIVCDFIVVADQLPASHVLEYDALVVLKRSNVDIVMLASLSAKP